METKIGNGRSMMGNGDCIVFLPAFVSKSNKTRANPVIRPVEQLDICVPPIAFLFWDISR